MTTILLILILFAVVSGVITLLNAIHKQTVALGRAYGNVNDLRTEVRDDLLDMRGDISRFGTLVENSQTISTTAIKADLLEMTTAITNAFMVETIEIKQGVEAIVDVLSSAASEPTPSAAAPTASNGPCQVQGCTKPAEVVTSWKTDILTPAQDVAVCEPHAAMMAKQAFQAPKNVRQAKVGEAPADGKCEHGVDMGPDYVTGQIHAHVDVPDRATFAKEHEIGEGAPDESVLKPEPFDPISAAIEAAYQSKKGEINAALDAQK